MAVDQVNTYDVLATDDVVFTRGAYDAFVGGTASSSDRPVTVVAGPAEETVEEKPATKKAAAKRATPKTDRDQDRDRGRGPDRGAADEAKPELPKGAKAPLKSGGAPKGYPVKGNADSGLFHEPDGQWYDATVAEFYFKTAEDAEAAGFTRAGGAARRQGQGRRSQ